MDRKNATEPARATASTSLTVRFWAAARAAAGVETACVSPGSVGDAIEDVRTKYPDLSPLLPRCSFLLDGIAVGRDDLGSTPAPAGTTLEILPPFAGG